MSPTTYFSHTASVDVWDASFRWREGARLRDRTIDSTWQRVADAIAGKTGASAALWAGRFVDAFSQWRLLPDERLLRVAGTAGVMDNRAPLHAVLNVAAFVIAPTSTRARLDFDRIADTAALAVRMLDDAAFAVPQAGEKQIDVRVGVIGLADALQLLDAPYDSPKARAQAHELAVAMARGTLLGSIELARERGASTEDVSELAKLWRSREMPASLIDDGLRWGVRHARITAIEPHPQLALLANNASDALDPLPCRMATADSRPPVDPLRQSRADGLSLQSQIELRAAMQPWIDLPIAYPLIADAEPSEAESITLGELPAKLGLPPLRFRHLNWSDS